MKKILLVLEIDLSLNNGAGINERESVIALLDQFAEHIIIIAPKPHHPNIFFDNRIHYIENHKRHGFFFYLRFILFTWMQISKFIKEQKIDAVVFRLGVWPILPILTSLTGVPIFLKTFSGYAMYERKDRRFLFKVISYILWPFYKKAVQTSKAIDTPSHALSAWAKSRFILKKNGIFVLANGANITDFNIIGNSRSATQLGYSNFQHIIGYVGAMDSIRYLDDMIKAMASLKSNLSIGLVLAGKGPYLDTLKKLAMDLKLSDNVIFLGFQPYKYIPEIINSFDVAFDITRVTLQIDGLETIGSYSQKIPQYLACGVPVIAQRCADTDFIEKHKLGKTILESTPQLLADACFEVIQNRNNGEYAPERIRNYAVNNLSYKSITKKRFDFWQQVLGRN